jgi:hypothetical protein
MGDHDAVNRNTVRLAVAVLAGWFAGALGGLAVVPYWAFAFVFTAVFVLPTAVAFWDSDWRRRPIPPSEVGRHRADYITGVRLAALVRRRYRVWWLAVVMALGLLAAVLNMFGGFASTVVSLDGERVHATRVRLDATKRARDPGYDVECVLARPDGTRIPGAIPIPDGDTCGATEDVVVDPYGLVDPVRQADDPADLAIGDVFVLGLALLTCVPAGRRRPSTVDG